MTTASSTFASYARKPGTVTNESPRILFDGRMTIMKLCGQCGEQMPHEIGKKVCILCAMNDEPETPPENPS